MNIFYLVDDQSHSNLETNSQTVQELASELHVGGDWRASIAGTTRTGDHLLQENDAVSFVTSNKTGGE
jgi:hypothetical protein|tara:strand:- start:343 stop:546 length:204 start_codon:yes stop_codon:yes gene_type:complete